MKDRDVLKHADALLAAAGYHRGPLPNSVCWPMVDTAMLHWDCLGCWVYYNTWGLGFGGLWWSAVTTAALQGPALGVLTVVQRQSCQPLDVYYTMYQFWSCEEPLWGACERTVSRFQVKCHSCSPDMRPVVPPIIGPASCGPCLLCVLSYLVLRCDCCRVQASCECTNVWVPM